MRLGGEAGEVAKPRGSNVKLFVDFGKGFDRRGA